MQTKRSPPKAVIRLLVLCLLLPSLSSARAAGEPALTLTAFGAVGDDRADDTQALQEAFRQVEGRCLDGEGRTFRVRGTLRVSTDFCLENARLRQDVAFFDTRQWIAGDCPVERDPEALIDCRDPAMAGPLPAGLTDYLYTRTLLIRPDDDESQITVALRNVTIDRGADPQSGARSDAAGIWIANAASLLLDGVEVTGAGKGYGVMIVNSANVTIRDLHLHDLVWAPYAGDTPLSLAAVQQTGWNTVPMREFRRAGDRSAPRSSFYGTRVQEQLSCLAIEGSHNVSLERLRIDGCRARFAEGDIPWQADGVGIGQSSRDIRIQNASITDTWEGIDIVGGGRGVSGVTISGAEISNSFNYAVKVGHNASDISVADSTLGRAGLAGIIFYGPVRNALVSKVRIDEPGSVFYAGMLQRPWWQELAGIVASPDGSGAYPAEVALDRVTVRGGRDCRFGLLNLTPASLAREDLTASGCEVARERRSP